MRSELSPRELAWHITDSEGTFISESSLYKILKRFLDYYNYRRVQESLDNLTPADFFHGRDREILSEPNIVNLQLLNRRRSETLRLSPLKIETVKPAMLRQSVS